MWFLRRRPTEFRGHVDSLTDDHVFGWAYDRSRPHKRLELEVYSGGALTGAVRAELFRDDLVNNGIGDGRYGFHFEFPTKNITRESIAVKVARSDFWLFNDAVASMSRSDSDSLMNSARKGLPILRPGLTARTMDEADVEIARQLLSEWQKYSALKDSDEFVSGNTMWKGIVASRHRSLLELLHGSDPRDLAAYFVDLQKTSASEGLSQGERAYRDFLSASPEGRRSAIAPFHDMLASLVQYMGLERAECGEQEYEGDALGASSKQLVTKIEGALGHPITSPPVFDGLFGLSIDGRILHGRDIQALYAALRAIEASASLQPHICEIGGGFGKAAEYAWLRGVRRYTIIDLPTVSAMQYFYLRRTLPNAPVRFCHPSEKDHEGQGIDLMFASHLDSSVKLSADIVLNCDSFPEMGDKICRSYFDLIKYWTPLLLSINQEANQPVGGANSRQTIVGSLLPEYGFTRRYRFRSWIRKGYVEELWGVPVSQSSPFSDSSARLG
jgi:hypothetical protein